MKMKKWLALATAGVMCVSLLAACGNDGGEAEVVDESIVEGNTVEEDGEEATPSYIQIPAVVINGTGVDIAAMYISGASQEMWGENVIPEGYVLPHGHYQDLVLNVDENNLQWDIRVEDSQGEALDFQGLDISEMPTEGFGIELVIKDGETTAAALADPSQMEGDYAPAE